MRSSKTGQYNLKDKKAQLYSRVSVSTPGLMPKTYYVAMTPAPTWCYTRQLSQSLTWEAKQYGDDETRLFVFNQGSPVTVYDYVYYRDKWYEVTRVDTTDDYNTDVFVYVKDAPIGGQPSEDELKPYGWKPEDDE